MGGLLVIYKGVSGWREGGVLGVVSYVEVSGRAVDYL